MTAYLRGREHYGGANALRSGIDLVYEVIDAHDAGVGVRDEKHPSDVGVAANGLDVSVRPKPGPGVFALSGAAV